MARGASHPDTECTEQLIAHLIEEGSLQETVFPSPQEQGSEE